VRSGCELAPSSTGHLGLTKEGDLVTGILRYSDTSSSRRYRADLGTRYPVAREFRVSPSVGGEYRTGVSTDFTEQAVNAKVGFDYALFRNVYLEAEVGGRYSWRDDVGGSSETFDTFVFVGYRIDFRHPPAAVECDARTIRKRRATT
jgi:hypothetical protein